MCYVGTPSLVYGDTYKYIFENKPIYVANGDIWFPDVPKTVA